MKYTTLFLMLSAPFLCRCARSQELPTVSAVDLEKYMGRWYEIAAFPASFQKGCRCSTAEYQMVPGKNYISVVNKCLQLKRGGSKMVVAKGKAYAVKGSGNSRLKVQFFWPFRGKYYIIELADDYSYVVVGHPNRNYLWILSREPYMPSDIYNTLVNRTKDKGFDVSRLKKTEHNCEDR